jgi:hypothetical protein
MKWVRHHVRFLKMLLLSDGNAQSSRCHTIGGPPRFALRELLGPFNTRRKIGPHGGPRVCIAYNAVPRTSGIPRLRTDKRLFGRARPTNWSWSSWPHYWRHFHYMSSPRRPTIRSDISEMDKARTFLSPVISSLLRHLRRWIYFCSSVRFSFCEWLISLCARAQRSIALGLSYIWGNHWAIEFWFLSAIICGQLRLSSEISFLYHTWFPIVLWWGFLHFLSR